MNNPTGTAPPQMAQDCQQHQSTTSTRMRGKDVES